MNLQTINIDQIRLGGAGFDNFIFTYPLDGRELETSIRNVGLLHPVCLRRDGDTFQIIFGARRVLACRNLGWQTIPARVFSSKELNPEQCLRMSLEEDLLQRNYNPVEKARVLQKFKELAGRAIRDLGSELAGKLRLAPTQDTIEDYLSLLDFTEDITSAVATDKVSPGHAFLLKSYNADERDLLFQQILLSCSPSFSEWRQLLDALDDLKVILKKNLPELLARRDIREVLESKRLNPRHKSTALLKTIRRLRYPHLTEYEEKFTTTLKATGLNGSIQIRHAPFFEGDYLDVSFRTKNENDLQKKLSTVNKIVDNGLFTRLFKIARGES